MPVYIVEKPAANTALLEYLHGKFPLAPEAYLRQLIKSGKVRHNGSPACFAQSLQPGDEIAVPASRKILDLLAQQERQPVILHESAKVLVVNKPAGLATHTGKGHENDNLTLRVRDMLLARNEQFMTAPVHRLDRPTSGPVIFGKGKKAIAELGKMLQQNAIAKHYLALTHTGLPEKGVLSGDIPGKGKIKYAETRFRTLESRHGLALLELELRTGRQHQIRRQLGDAGHPIAGDNRYGGPDLPGLHRLFLHCHLLSFTDPFSRQPTSIHVPLPEALEKILEANGFAFIGQC